MESESKKLNELKEYFFKHLFIFELTDERKLIGRIQMIEKNGNILLKDIVEELPMHKISPLNEK